MYTEHCSPPDIPEANVVVSSSSYSGVFRLWEMEGGREKHKISSMQLCVICVVCGVCV